MAKNDIATAERRASCFGNLSKCYNCLLRKDHATDKERESAAKLAAAAEEQAKKYSSPASEAPTA